MRTSPQTRHRTGTPSSRLARATVLFVAVVLVAAPPASSFLPKAERIARAAANENRSASRTQALKLALALRVGDRDPIATGSLITHPNGLARLELVDASDLVERHLLLGTEHRASRAGVELAEPRSFLPPLFLLQAPSQLVFEKALLDHGLDILSVGLAPCQQRVCYVIGDPSRVPPPPAPTEEELAQMRAAEVAGSVDRIDDAMATEGRAPEQALPSAPVATIWVDTGTFEVVRIESRDGVAIELGQPVVWGDVRFPGSVTIIEPAKEPVHLDVLSVTPVNAPAAEFSRSWLLAPASELPTALPR